MMSSSVFFALLCIFSVQAQLFFIWSDDDDYYTTTVTTTYEIYPQDDTDAKAIANDKMSEKIFASILPYREKLRRMTIIREIGKFNGGVQYLDDKYVPQDSSGPPFKDLIYALTIDENTVMGGYLEVFFEHEDTAWIIMAMVLTKDIQQMIKSYDTYHSPKTFKDLRKKQSGIFEHMLRVWVYENREPNENGALDKNLVTQDVNSLRCENDTGGWKENRDILEKILIKKSIKHAQAVLAEFEKAVGQSIEKVIEGNVQTRGLDPYLGLAYSSTATYIKNKHDYIAGILHPNDNVHVYRWAAWIMSLAVVSPKEWPKVDAAFQKKYNGVTLSKFIQQKMTEDKIMAEMIAVIIDPKFKPTTFTEIPVAKGASPTPTPPPVPPTTQAPTTSG